MKNIVLFIVFISFLNCGFSQNIDRDTIYFDINRSTTIDKICCLQTKKTRLPNIGLHRKDTLQINTISTPVYYKNDSTLFNGVLISKSLLNIGGYGNILSAPTYTIIVWSYNNGVIKSTKSYIFIKNKGKYFDQEKKTYHTTFGKWDYYLASTIPRNGEVIHFFQNGDTSSYTLTEATFDPFDKYQITKQKELNKTYYKNNKIKNFSSSVQNLTPNTSNDFNSYEYRYHLNKNGDTTSYFTYMNGKKNGYTLYTNPLRGNDTIRYKVRTIMKNDSLYNVLDTNLIYVDTKFNLLTEKEFIAKKNDKMPYGFALFSQHTLLKVKINGATYYIVFPQGSQYGYTDDYYNIVSQKTIDKIIKKYKKYLLKN